MDLRKAVCEINCAYYKAGGNEDLACGGLIALRRLPQPGAIAAAVPVGPVPAGLAAPLSLVLCPSCPYYLRDCDFAEGVDGAPPCGGFAVIGSLLLKGDLLIDGLMSAI